MTEGPTGVSLLGLNGAGKTTYAVVFFTACEAGKAGMEITKYSVGDRGYLNELADELAKCESLTRTSQRDPEEIRLRVRLGVDLPERELVMPDLSGELLRDSMVDRTLDPSLAELVQPTDALLLFVRSNKIVEPTTIKSLNDLLISIGEAPGEETAPENPEDWEVRFAATQARLTDIAQEIVRVRKDASTRVGLVLSAWDTQDDKGLAPGAWTEQYLPLLAQFLDNNVQSWDVFGVSAQGGDFSGPERSDLEKLGVADRPKVQRANGEDADIGAPLRWVLEEQ